MAPRRTFLGLDCEDLDASKSFPTPAVRERLQLAGTACSRRLTATSTGVPVGDGDLVDRPKPTVVPGLSGMAMVLPGLSDTCVARGRGGPPMPGGFVVRWGGNSNGQVGADVSGTSPQASFESVPINTVAAGQRRSCAVMADGSAACWGLNNHGQLGDGSTLDKHSPATVSF